MRKRSTIAVVVVVVVVLTAGLFFVTKKDVPPAKSAQQQSLEDKQSGMPDAVDIVYTGYGFSPYDIGLSPGATVTIINESSKDLEFASDPYPTSVDNPELNIGRIAPGERKSFQVTKKGLWGYHNRLEPTEKGRFAVLSGE